METPMSDYSMFIQPFGYTPDTIRPMLEKLVEVKQSPGGHHIYNICIEHVANNKQDPVPWDVIDTIMEFAPHFDNLFVGSSNLMYNGPGSKYREGVHNRQFKAEALTVANDYAQRFAARYANDHYYNFYIDFEGVANWWVEPETRAGYADLLSRWVNMYERILPNRKMLYCPATWNMRVPDGMQLAVANLFSTVRTYTPSGIQWITFQDMYGRRNDWLDPTPQDVKNWLAVFKGTGLFENVRTTMELFETIPGHYGTASSVEVKQRFAEYDTMGIPIGFVFELRYWDQIMQAWGGEPGVEPPPLDDTPAVLSTTTFTDEASLNTLENLIGQDGLVEATVVGLHE